MTALHCMLDLETWSSKKNATIISIGAVKFVPNGGDTADKFHVAINPGLTHGLNKLFDIDPNTMNWWLDPAQDEARRTWLGMQKVDLATALVGFADWLGQPSMPIWGNASTFDNVILRNAYETLGIETPWSFREDHCYRTMKNLLPEVKPERLFGVAHDALADAEFQAAHLQQIFAHLGL